MMNKVLSFLIATLMVLSIDLFNFEVTQGPPQNMSANVTTDAMAASNDEVVDSSFGFGFKPAFDSINSGDNASMQPGQVFDPVTMLLLGSGLIGLAGLGRKKI